MGVSIGPRIGIEGEAEYRKQINNIIQQSKTLASQMKSLTSSFDGNKKSIQQNAEQHKLLQKQIDNQKDRLKQLNSMLEQSKSKFGENSTQTLKWQQAVNEAEAQLNSLQSELKALPSSLDIVASKMAEFGDKLSGISTAMINVGKNMTTYVTTPIVTGFAAAVKEAGEFDSVMSKVQAISGASAEEMAALREQALYMGKTTVFSSKEAGEALTYMGMAGWKADQMIDGLSGIMNLAAASGEELGATSDIVTDALTAFGMKAEESGRFADILASAATNSNTTVSMMGESFQYAAPVAGALGYSAEDVAIALGLMANSGIKASMAGTSLRNMFQRMAKPTKESSMAMERLGLELYDSEGQMYSFREIMDQLRVSMKGINAPVEDYEKSLDELDAMLEDGTLTEKKYEAALEELNLQTFGAEGAEKARAAAMLGGARAMSGLLAIANATEEDYNKLSDAIDNSSQEFVELKDGSIIPVSEALKKNIDLNKDVVKTYNGTAEAMSAIMLNNLPGQITLLKSAISNFAISIGNLLMPKIREIVTGIQNWVDMFNGLGEAEKMQIIKLGGLLAAIGPVLMAGGKIVGIIANVMKAAPMIATAFQGIGTALSVIASPIGIIIAAIGALVAAFVYLWNTNEGFRTSIIATWQQIVTSVQTFISQITERLAALGINWQTIIDGLATAWNVFAEILAPIFEGVFSYIALTMQAVFDVIISIVDMIVAAVNGDGEAFKAALVSFLITIFNYFKSKLLLILNTIKNVVNVILGFFGTSLGEIKSKVQETFTSVVTAVSSKMAQVKNFVVGKFNEICNFISSLPSRFFGWGSDMMSQLTDGIKAGIQGVKDGISDVASTIASYIHFSQPDKGALSNFNSFMPDMMKQMAAQIEGGRYQVKAAVGHVAADIAAPLASTPSVTMNNNFSFTGGYTEADGRDIVRRINRQLGAVYI